MEKNTLITASHKLGAFALPDGKYVGVTASGADRQAALNYLYFTWFPKHGLFPVGEMEVEFINADGKFNTLYIPIESNPPSMGA